MATAKNEKQIIGRIDKVDFPELGIFNIDAKVDSGAFTSAIHCSKIKLIEGSEVPRVQFIFYDDEKNRLHEMQVFSRKKVKSSFGAVQDRITVLTNIRLFGKMFDIELALTDRSSMKFPVLLGRKILTDNFLVDVNHTNLSFKSKIKSANKKKKKK